MLKSETKKRLIFLALFIVDFFASFEITALTVAAPKISDRFSLNEGAISWMINSYFYVVFIFLIIFLISSGWISRKIGAKYFLFCGLTLFALGSIVAFVSSDAQIFLIGRFVQGVGAAMAFIGQLWVMTESYKDEIKIPLFWTEVGFVSGVVSGPILGGLLTGAAAQGWRLIFLLNTVLCLVGSLIILFLYSKQNGYAYQDSERKGKLGKYFFIAAGCEMVITMAAVASEFITSIYLQDFKNYSSFMAGLVLLSGSVGLVVGSWFITRTKSDGYPRMIQGGLGGIIATLIITALLFSLEIIYLIPIALFFIGFFIGFFGVATYSYISQIVPENLVIKGAIIYLIAMQLGNAAGIQMENFWVLVRHNFTLLIFPIVVILGVALFASLKLKNGGEGKSVVYGTN